MVLTPDNHVRLAPADWGGLCSIALTLLMLVGATLYQVHDLAATNRERLARFEAELTYLKSDVVLLKNDVRLLVRETRR